MSDLDEKDESIEYQLALTVAANRDGKIRGVIVISYMADRDLSVQIAGDFDTYTNTLGLMEAARDIVKVHKLQQQAEKDAQKKQKKPLNWGPGGNA